MRDRSSRPRTCPHQTDGEVVGKIVYLRQHYHFGPAKIAMYLARYHDVTQRRTSESQLGTLDRHLLGVGAGDDLDERLERLSPGLGNVRELGAQVTSRDVDDVAQWPRDSAV